MREQILICCISGFLIGVFCASFLPLTAAFTVALLGGAAVFLFASWFASAPRTLFIVFFLCMVVLGLVRFDIGRVLPDPALSGSLGSRISIEGRVIAEPDVRERSVRLFVETPDDLRVLVIAPPFTRVTYGDDVAVSGTLALPEAFEIGPGRSFDYPAYLASRKITHVIEFADVDVRGRGGNMFMRMALAVKAQYVHGLRLTLPEPYAGLAAGITAGDKRSVGTELSETFMRVSLVHILVLSGYNITVVMSALLSMCGGLSRTPKLVVSLGTVLFFILISGAAASSVRAGAMAFAAVFATMYGRRFAALRVLLGIVLVMVMWDPYILAFDPGFQLSVLATLGLILFAGDISQRLRFLTQHFAIRDIVASTIATQVTVLPLLMYQNGSLSLVSLPANIFALIAVPVAMATSAAAALAGILFGTWGTIFALPAYALLRYIVGVAELFAQVPFAAVTVPAFSGYVVIAVYSVLFLYALIRYRTQTKNPA